MRVVVYALLGSIAIVCLSYLGFSWYYERYDVEEFDIEHFTQSTPPPVVANNTQKLLENPLFSELSDEVDSILTEDGMPSVVTDADEMQRFTDFVTGHPFTNHPEDEDKALTLISRYDEAEGDERIEIGMEIIDYHIGFHDFMTGLLQRHAEGKIPFRRDSDEFAAVTQIIDTYIEFVETSDDPFLLAKLKEVRRQPKRSPESIEMRRKYDEWSQSN